MNQTRLGELVGVEQSTIAGWETGKRYPESHDAFERLAVALGCDVAWLRYGVELTPESLGLLVRIQQLPPADRALVESLIDSLQRRTA